MNFNIKPEIIKSVKIILVILIFADLSYSYLQHIHQPLDGDMAWNLIPADDVKPILESPFGLKAIINDTTYANPNRFFCHYSFKEYLLNTPLLLQKFLSPIESVYHACGISKIITQILLLIILSMLIANTFKLFKLEFSVTALIISPLFQTNGYRGYMGIIDPSTTYTFFYAIPTLLILVYFLPYFYKLYYNKSIINTKLQYFIFLVLTIPVCLSGALNPGIILTISSKYMTRN